MDWNIFIPLIAAIITVFLGFFLDKFFYNRPRLVAYYSSISAFKVKSPDGSSSDVGTHTVVVRNTGKLSAKNVRLGHVFLPPNYTVSPTIRYEILDMLSGCKEIVIPILVPNEQVTISYLYFPPITVRETNTYVKSDEGFARIVNFIPSPNLLGWQKVFLYVLLFFGCSTVIYLAIHLFILLIPSLKVC